MSPRAFRFLLNVYPPFVGAGIRVTFISPDWRHIRVRMPRRWYNRNYVGTHFGGSLYAMTDPFFMIMVMKNLGPDFIVWDKAAEIEFVAPGRRAVHTAFHVTDQDLEDIRAHTTAGERYLPWFSTEVVDETGAVVARVRKQLYIRRKSASARAAASAPVGRP